MQKKKEIKGRENSKYCVFLVFSPDGQNLITGENDGLIVRDSQSLKEIALLNGSNPQYSPDGCHIVTSDSKIKIWDAKTYKLIHVIYPIPGIYVQGVDLRHLHPDSRLSDEVKERLYEYGAIVDERG